MAGGVDSQMFGDMMLSSSFNECLKKSFFEEICAARVVFELQIVSLTEIAEASSLNVTASESIKKFVTPSLALNYFQS